MYLSTSMLNNAINKLSQENFNLNYLKTGAYNVFSIIVFVIALIFFLLELLVLYYSIKIALMCSKSSPERVVNLVLAITFTLPYALINLTFNECAIKVLRS